MAYFFRKAVDSMIKTELLDRFAKTGEERMLLAKTIDKLERAQKRQTVENTDFLSPAEQAVVQAMLRHCGSINTCFFGGYEGAERAVCVFMPDWMEELDESDSPLAAVQTELYSQAKLSHRDILGALMGLGLTRGKIGDILLSESRCQVLVRREVLSVVTSQWESAGRYGVSPREISLSELDFTPPSLKEISTTVQSLRLDSVFSSGFSMSRSKAVEQIASGRVSVNHVESKKPDKLLDEGDTVSCRGLGKFVLREVSGKSRKDRIIIKIDRYV